MVSDSDDAQKIRQAEQRAIKKKKVKTSTSFTQSSSSRSLKHPVFSFGMPVSKMDIPHQSLQKQNLNKNQTTPSTIPSDSPERPKVQTPAWVAENKTTGEKTVQKFNSTTYQSFDSNSELIDGFENLKNMEFEFRNQKIYISVKGN